MTEPTTPENAQENPAELAALAGEAFHLCAANVCRAADRPGRLGAAAEVARLAGLALDEAAGAAAVGDRRDREAGERLHAAGNVAQILGQELAALAGESGSHADRCARRAADEAQRMVTIAPGMPASSEADATALAYRALPEWAREAVDAAWLTAKMRGVSEVHPDQDRARRYEELTQMISVVLGAPRRG